jgi:hypothetical protein
MHAGLSPNETFNSRFLHFNPKAKIKILFRIFEVGVLTTKPFPQRNVVATIKIVCNTLTTIRFHVFD